MVLMLRDFSSLASLSSKLNDVNRLRRLMLPSIVIRQFTAVNDSGIRIPDTLSTEVRGVSIHRPCSGLPFGAFGGIATQCLPNTAPAERISQYMRAHLHSEIGRRRRSRRSLGE